MSTFSVILLTAPSPDQAGEADGAYVKIDGRECLLRSVELFLNRENVKQILLAVGPERLDEVKHKFGAHLSFSGVKLISGGPLWLDQVAAAAAKVNADPTHVILHDAARPIVPFSDIDALMEAAAQRDVVGLCTPMRATLIETNEGGQPTAYHPANRFVQLQTPQCFSKSRFDEMAGTKQEMEASTVHLVQGSPLNIRVNHAGDAALAKTLLNLLPKPKKNPLTNPFEEAQW
jgi:2-C-methyl-D-erythritol 4-phosphate cytidylyltransferase